MRPGMDYVNHMVSDITLALAYVVLFFVLGGIAFAYLKKGKN